jgi:lysyl-tRNA synthetase class 2
MMTGDDDWPMTSWQPTASIDSLRRRAAIVARVRAFFEERGVLEVETPLLAAAPVTDPHLAAFSCRPRPEAQAGSPSSEAPARLYLQTSPEYAMKRLLAAGSGPIYQICKAFRQGESGRHHNPEFTMLEWYRPGFDHHRLMDEVDALLVEVLGTPPGERRTYAEVVAEHAGIDPLTAGLDELRAAARDHGLGHGLELDDPDGWLDLLMGGLVQPRLGHGRPTFILDYPARQAALARVRPGPRPVAERFEVYVSGQELANGYHELLDPAEHRRRFAADLERRRTLGLPAVPVDERLLAALEAGLPPCAGVALGLDRLILLALGASELADVLSFPIERA